MNKKAHARLTRAYGKKKHVRLCQKSEKKNPDGFLSNLW
jgi:hypothetical protein